MKQFIFKADCTFYAEDLQAAASIVQDHFLQLVMQLQLEDDIPDADPLMDAGMIGSVSLEPVMAVT